jgi:hypothetical protein
VGTAHQQNIHQMRQPTQTRGHHPNPSLDAERVCFPKSFFKPSFSVTLSEAKGLNQLKI